MGDSNNRNRAFYYEWLYVITEVNPFRAHGNGGNLLWADLHVEKKSQEELLENQGPWMFHSWNGCKQSGAYPCP